MAPQSSMVRRGAYFGHVESGLCRCLLRAWGIDKRLVRTPRGMAFQKSFADLSPSESNCTNR
jgi:hypothetical protein